MNWRKWAAAALTFTLVACDSSDGEEQTDSSSQQSTGSGGGSTGEVCTPGTYECPCIDNFPQKQCEDGLFCNFGKCRLAPTISPDKEDTDDTEGGTTTGIGSGGGSSSMTNGGGSSTGGNTGEQPCDNTLACVICVDNLPNNPCQAEVEEIEQDTVVCGSESVFVGGCLSNTCIDNTPACATECALDEEVTCQN